MTAAYALGERVWATLGQTGFPRPGVVTAVIRNGVTRQLSAQEAWYMVKFDGDQGQSGPCAVIRAERRREDGSATTGTAT